MRGPDKATTYLGWATRIAVACAALALPAADTHAAGCSFTGASSVAFGAYDPFSAAPLDTVGTVSWRCSGLGVPRIELDAGGSGSFAWRTLLNGPETLRYNLFLDAARTVVWGDGTGGSAAGPVTFTTGGGLERASVYGRIPAGQDVGWGTFTDTIRVTFFL